MTKILIIDDEVQIRTLLARILSLENYEVAQADSIKSATKQLSLHKQDLVLCDVKLPDGNGLEFIPNIKKLQPDVEVIMLTAHGNIADGVQAIKYGAYDYLTKGDDNDRIVPLLANAAEKVAMSRRLNHLEAIVNKRYSFDSIQGKSATLQTAVQMAQKVACTDASVLLIGETGTGKEVFANAIHYASKRANKSFVAVNCSAISHNLMESELFGHKAGAFTGANKDKKGLFEQADKGTIFLDEIGEMPVDLQAKLLRVLECGEFIKVGDCTVSRVNVRVIAATNRNMKECIASGLFREDLFYRLSVFTIELPALRHRKEDISLLSQNFISIFSAKQGKRIDNIEKSFFETLTNHSWNGNIRELRNVIERAVILANDNKLTVMDLPQNMNSLYDNTTNEMELAQVEKKHILNVLRITGGNKTETAHLLKIGLTTLYRKLEEYKLN